MNHPVITRKYLSVCIAWLTILLPAISIAQPSVTIAPSLMDFDYVEYDDNGNFLDGEKGVIPGIELGFSFIQPETQFGFVFAFKHFAGDVDYDGHIQSSDAELDGLPLETKTNEDVTEFYFGLTKGVVEGLFLEAGFSIKEWDRDIQGKFIDDPKPAFVSGLYEVYEWNQFSIGGKVERKIYGEHYLNFKIAYLKIIDPKMKLFGSVYKLQAKSGSMLEAGWQYRLDSQKTVGLVGNITKWEFGRSPVVNGFYEPDSESEMRTLKLTFTISMD